MLIDCFAHAEKLLQDIGKHLTINSKYYVMSNI